MEEGGKSRRRDRGKKTALGRMFQGTSSHDEVIHDANEHLLGLHREIFSKVYLAHSCPVEWEVGSAVHKDTGQTQSML